MAKKNTGKVKAKVKTVAAPKVEEIKVEKATYADKTRAEVYEILTDKTENLINEFSKATESNRGLASRLIAQKKTLQRLLTNLK